MFVIWLSMVKSVKIWLMWIDKSRIGKFVINISEMICSFCVCLWLIMWMNFFIR